MGFSQTPRIFTTFFELIHRNNKASLVNMLVTFCGKVECSFLTGNNVVFVFTFFNNCKGSKALNVTNYESYN